MSSLAVTAIDHIVLNVNDVETSCEWYSKVLGMKRHMVTSNGGQRDYLLFGKQRINIRPKTATQKEWFTAKNVVEGTADLCFLVEATPEAVEEHLKSHGVEIGLGPVDKVGAHGTIHSLYCRDPDGSLIEISSY